MQKGPKRGGGVLRLSADDLTMDSIVSFRHPLRFLLGETAVETDDSPTSHGLLVKGARVLDVGCGVGGASSHIASQYGSSI